MKKLLVLSMLAITSVANAANIHLDLDLRAMRDIQKESVRERRHQEFTTVLFDQLVKKGIYIVDEKVTADYFVEGEAIELSTRGNPFVMCSYAKYQIQGRIYDAKTKALVGLAKVTAKGVSECAEDSPTEGKAERKSLEKFYKELTKELKRIVR